MSSSVLILAPRSDLHAAAVCWGLGRNGIDVIWAPSFADTAIGSVSLRAGTGQPWTFSSPGIRGSLRSVWFRRPQKPRNFPHSRKCDLPCLSREWSEFHDNLYALHRCDPDVLWVNSPQAAILTENKLLQLETASQCGLVFPETLASNDPGEVRRFIGQHGQVIFKGFATYAWKNRLSGKMHALWTRLINSSTVLDDASVRLCPGIYQQYVEKSADIRVTVVGERAFAMRISPTKSRALVDWRQHAVTWRNPALPKAVRAEAVSLPQCLQYKLIRLMRRLGIVFGCIDLAIDADGTAYFLEVNQGGEFLFAEEMVESLPLLRAMCSLLATGRLDYSLDAIGPLSYLQYRQSDEYVRWRRDVASARHEDLRQRSVILE